jgi:hypothetical protein
MGIGCLLTVSTLHERRKEAMESMPEVSGESEWLKDRSNKAK